MATSGHWSNCSKWTWLSSSTKEMHDDSSEIFHYCNGGNQKKKKWRRDTNTYHCCCGNQPLQASSCATWSLIYGVNRKHCLQQHRCWTNSWGIDFGVWPNWWHHYVDWISLCLIKMLYVQSQEGRGLAGYRNEEKEMQSRSGIFLLGHLPSVFKH